MKISQLQGMTLGELAKMEVGGNMRIVIQISLLNPTSIQKIHIISFITAKNS